MIDQGNLRKPKPTKIPKPVKQARDRGFCLLIVCDGCRKGWRSIEVPEGWLQVIHGLCPPATKWPQAQRVSRCQGPSAHHRSPRWTLAQQKCRSRHHESRSVREGGGHREVVEEGTRGCAGTPNPRAGEGVQGVHDCSTKRISKLQTELDAETVLLQESRPRLVRLESQPPRATQLAGHKRGVTTESGPRTGRRIEEQMASRNWDLRDTLEFGSADVISFVSNLLAQGATKLAARKAQNVSRGHPSVRAAEQMFRIGVVISVFDWMCSVSNCRQHPISWESFGSEWSRHNGMDSTPNAFRSWGVRCREDLTCWFREHGFPEAQPGNHVGILRFFVLMRSGHSTIDSGCMRCSICCQRAPQ